MNIFSWDNNGGRGPWGAPKGNRSGSSKKPSGGRRPQDEIHEVDVDEMFRAAQERIQSMFGGGSGGAGNSRVFLLLAFALIGVWLVSGFYIVAPDEQGVVMRFGKYVQTTEPGLNYHLPSPFEAVLKPKVRRENILEVGFSTGAQSSGFFGNTQVGRSSSKADSLMLTGDENIVDLDFTVRWKIADARDYLFNIVNPDMTIEDVAQSAMREVIGAHPIDDALTENKDVIEQETRELMQQVLNDYRAGVQITGVELQRVNPPAEVIDAFRDVQAARADNEKLQSEAIGYSNDIIPRARGEASQIVQDAEAYKAAKVSEAQGAADRFKSQVAEYQKAKTVTAKRMYFETMEEVLRDAQKVIISNEAGSGVVPYLPLDKLKGGSR